MKTHELSLRVRYSETDSMARVHNSRYMIFFEEARTDLVRALGLPYSKIEEEGIILPVSEATLKFKKALVYDEVIRVAVTLAFVKNYSVKFKYVIYGQSGDIACTGTTIHAALDREKLEFVEIPEPIKEILHPYIEDR